MQFNIKMFADGANIEEIRTLRKNELVSGFTTNPTLMAKSGIKNYESFAKEAAQVCHPYSISFEVFSDDLNEMVNQAKKISKWAENIFVKIPVTNTKKEFTGSVISELANSGVKLNITAIMSVEQVKLVCEKLNRSIESIISVFAGRIADAGVDPVGIMAESLKVTKSLENAKLLWASPREIYNLIQANEIGCDIITMTPDLWKKMKIIGTNLEDYSLATVKMFYEDGLKSGLSI